MILHVGGRQVGKTTRLVHWLVEGRAITKGVGWTRVIFVSSAAERERIINMLLAEYGAIVDWSALVRSPGPNSLQGINMQATEIGIDEVQWFLSSMFNAQIGYLTITGDDDRGRTEQVNELYPKP